MGPSAFSELGCSVSSLARQLQWLQYIGGLISSISRILVLRNPPLHMTEALIFYRGDFMVPFQSDGS